MRRTATGYVCDRDTQLTVEMAQEDITNSSRDELFAASRRNILKGSAVLLAAGGAGRVITNVVRSASAATGSTPDAPPQTGNDGVSSLPRRAGSGVVGMSYANLVWGRSQPNAVIFQQRMQTP